MHNYTIKQNEYPICKATGKKSAITTLVKYMASHGIEINKTTWGKWYNGVLMAFNGKDLYTIERGD